MEKQNYTFAFFFFPNSDNWRSSNNKTIEEVFTPSRTFSPQNLRDIIGNGDSDRTVAMRSVPRGSLDGSSYVYAPTTGTGDGTRNGQNRLIELEYCIETDLVNEYLGDNAEKHHLDIKEVQELNTLRYSAPLSPDKSWTEKKAAVNRVYISHNSLSRNGAIDIIGKEIKSIRIPFKLGSESDYLVSGMLQNNMTNRQGGMCHTNRKIHISLDNGTTFIESSNYFAYSYFDEHMIYEWFFESENINDLKYSGNGIFIKAAPPSGENGSENFALNLYKKDEKYYAYSSEDLVDTTNGNYRNINATADIKVIFNYIQRGEWFDYIETKENDTLIEVKNINDYINEHSYIINSFYTTQHTYTRYINDRIGFKWVELCPAHSLTLKGELKRVDVVTSSNQWTAYTNPVYLCIYEKNDENVFVKKAVSTNSLTPQRASIASWTFDNVLFEGKPIRVGYILEPEDTLAELGETQPNPSMQTNAITGETGYDGECYVCNDSGVRQNFGCPMSFTFTNIVNIKNDISDLQENTTTINQNIADINQSISNINQTINNISQSGILNLGKWRIYINDNGDLVIDTEALASAGKSITFKDIEI
jgi:hypothetical protein